MCSTYGYTSSSTYECTSSSAHTLGLFVSIRFKTVDIKTLWIPWPIDIYADHMELLPQTKPCLTEFPVLRNTNV